MALSRITRATLPFPIHQPNRSLMNIQKQHMRPWQGIPEYKLAAMDGKKPHAVMASSYKSGEGKVQHTSSTKGAQGIAKHNKCVPGIDGKVAGIDKHKNSGNCAEMTNMSERINEAKPGDKATANSGVHISAYGVKAQTRGIGHLPPCASCKKVEKHNGVIHAGQKGFTYAEKAAVKATHPAPQKGSPAKSKPFHAAPAPGALKPSFAAVAAGPNNANVDHSPPPSSGRASPNHSHVERVKRPASPPRPVQAHQNAPQAAHKNTPAPDADGFIEVVHKKKAANSNPRPLPHAPGKPKVQPKPPAPGSSKPKLKQQPKKGKGKK